MNVQDAMKLKTGSSQKASEGMMFERGSGDQPGEGFDFTRVVPADQRTFLKRETVFFDNYA